MNKDSTILIRNIYYMLSYVYRALEQDGYKSLAAEEFDGAADLFAAILLRGVSRQLKRGLVKEYVQRESVEPVLRGKIDINGTIRERIRSSAGLLCSYEELTEDVLWNRIVKTALLALLSCDKVSKKNRMLLKKTLPYLNGISEISPAQIPWEKLNYHSQTAEYRMLMEICRLFWDKSVMTEQAGNRIRPVFLSDRKLSKLFELFILEYYRRHFPDFKAAAKQVAWDTEEFSSYLPVMRTDIMLSDGEKRLIIDAKFYSASMQTYYGRSSLHSPHLYQMYAYVRNADRENRGNVSGLLLYAKTGEETVPHFTSKISGNRISAEVLDLNLPFEQIAGQLEKIAACWADYSVSSD